MMGRTLQRILTYLVITLVAIPRGSAMEIDKLDWSLTWDQRERPEAQGKATSIAFFRDSLAASVTIFGWLGTFPSFRHDGCVGFGKIAAPLHAVSVVNSIQMKVTTDSPDIFLQLTIVDAKTHQQNARNKALRQYVKKFRATDGPSTIQAFPEDFLLTQRGIEIPGADQVDLGEIVQIGFQLQRSIQDIGDCQQRLPFSFTVSELILK
jgi:hypothetical protein